MKYHHGGDDGDEGVAVGQQSLGGLGAAVAISVGRSDALRERRGGGCVTPRLVLLHLLLQVVLYDVAVVVSLHRRGARGPQVSQTGTMDGARQAGCLQTVERQLVVEEEEEEAETGSSFPVVNKDR